MAAEKLSASLSIQTTDVDGNVSQPIVLPSQYTSQTRILVNSISVALSSTVDLWDPSTWTGFPWPAFNAFIVAIEDVGVTPSVTPLQMELLPSFNTTAKCGIVLTIPAGDWIKIPSNASINNPTLATDQFTGGSAALINRIRLKNASTTTAVKARLWLIDSTAP